MHTNGTHTAEACGIEYDPSDFPQRRDSPDPGDVIRAIERCGGVVRDAAKELDCTERTLYKWSAKYDAINEAVEQNRSTIAYESRDRLVDLMRQDDDKRVAKDSAIKLATMYDPNLDWSRKERREYVDSGEDEEELQEDVSEMSEDELLEELSKRTGTEI